MKILLVLCAALELVFVPIFLKHYWPQKCAKSLFYKMVCATLFVLCGILSMKISGNTSPYATLIMWALALGWVGDLFLHVLSEKAVYFIIGFFAFLAGHIIYIVAFFKAFQTTYPNEPFIAWYQIVFTAVLLLGTVIFAFAKKLVNKKTWVLLVGIVLYGTILTTMLSQAFRYAIGEIVYGTNDYMVMVFLTVAIGSLLFFISDAVLGVILGLNQNQRYMRIINITTYFAGQVLLACSILFVQSQQLIGG